MRQQETVSAGGPRRFTTVADMLLRLGLPALVVLAPLRFGAVGPVAVAALSLGAVLLGLALLLRRTVEPIPERLIIGLPGLLGLLFLAFAALQLVPLSPRWMARLSPAATRVYLEDLPGYGGPADEILRLEGEVLPRDALPAAEDRPVRRPLSLDPLATQEALRRAALYLLVFILALNVCPSLLPPRAAILAMVGIGAFEAGYGLLEFLSRHQRILGYVKKYYTDSVTGTYINRNHFAGLLELVLPLTLGLVLSLRRETPGSGRRTWRDALLLLTRPRGAQAALLVLACAVMATALLLSFSRAGILLGSLGLGLTAALARPASRAVRRALPVVLILAAAAVPAYIAGSARILERYGALAADLETERGRIPVWKETLRLASDFPVTGVGLGAFGSAFPAYRPARTGLYDHAHNDYLELLAETGWPGLLLALSAAAICLGRSWRAIRRARPGERALLAGSVGGMAALLAHGLVDFNGQIPANMVLLACAAGISLSLSGKTLMVAQPHEASPTWLRALRVGPAPVVLLVFGALAVQDLADRAPRAEGLRAIRSWSSGKGSEIRARAPEALSRLGDPLRRSRPDPEALALFSRYSLLAIEPGTPGPEVGAPMAGDAAAGRDRAYAAYRSARQAMEMQPTRAEHHLLAALALQAAELARGPGAEGEAGADAIEELVGRLLQRASRLDPRDPALRYTVGTLYLARDRVEEAAGEFAASLQAGDRFAEEIYRALWPRPDGPALVERVTPKHPAGDLALARFHHHAGRYAEAEALYRRVLTDSRLGPAGAEGLIWVMLRQDRPGDAWAVCDDLEKRFPGQKGRVAFWRGQIAARRGDWGGAVRHFETALRSDPASEEIQWALAEAFCEKGENQACIARLTFLLEEGSRSFRDRREASARLLLGRALEREGRIQDSLLQYMKAASLDPRNRDVVAAVERLRRSL